MNSTIQLSLSWLIHNILLVFASLAFLYTLLRVIHNLLFSPLSAIPGPWYVAVSDLWLTSHVLHLQQYKTIQLTCEDRLSGTQQTRWGGTWDFCCTNLLVDMDSSGMYQQYSSAVHSYHLSVLSLHLTAR
jgi:hypothetical protein